RRVLRVQPAPLRRRLRHLRHLRRPAPALHLHVLPRLLPRRRPRALLSAAARARARCCTRHAAAGTVFAREASAGPIARAGEDTALFARSGADAGAGRGAVLLAQAARLRGRAAVAAGVPHAGGVPALAVPGGGVALLPLARRAARLLEAVHARAGLPLRPRADGYGERRIGTDCHGVPVYANKKGGVEDAVVVEVPPPAIGSVQWHDAGEVPATGNAQWHDHGEVPAIGNVQWHDHAEVPAIGNVQWHDAGETHDQSNWLSSYDNAKEDTYAYAHSTYGSYDTSYEQSYSVNVVSDEPTWFPNQSYHDVYREEEPRYQEVLPSYGIESTFSSQPIYCYNQHSGEQPLHVQVEPPETFYSHKLEYHENFSTYTNHIDNSEISTQSCEIQPYAYVPDSPVEAYQPSWSMNLGYYQDSAEEVTPQYDNHAFESGEYGGMASIFSSSSYPTQQVEVYEQSYGDEYVSLEQNFQSNWNAFSEDTSEITKSVSIRACIVIFIFCKCYRSNCNA
uniref:Uncharacterized protein n=1 Tax=Aegilops tauschii subsp. strangulata TaxID=200361 RepID=A0A453AN99_AEGTS